MVIDFEYDLEIENHTLHLLIEVDGRITQELYGADADGNRGEWRSDVEIKAVKVIDGHGKDITAKLERKYPRQLESIWEQAENELFETENE